MKDLRLRVWSIVTSVWLLMGTPAHCILLNKNRVDSDTVSTYQVFSVQLVTDKKLEACNKA